MEEDLFSFALSLLSKFSFQVKRNSCFEEEDRVLLRLKAAEIAEMICSESAVSCG